MLKKLSKTDNRRPGTVVKVTNVLYDARLRDFIKKAHRGNLDAARLIQETFLYGDDEHPRRYYRKGIRAKRDVEIARYYNEISQKLILKSKRKDKHTLYVYELENRACIEADDGNFKQAKNYFLKAIKYQTKYIVPEEWNFNLFRNLEELFLFIAEQGYGKKNRLKVFLEPLDYRVC